MLLVEIEIFFLFELTKAGQKKEANTVVVLNLEVQDPYIFFYK